MDIQRSCIGDILLRIYGLSTLLQVTLFYLLSTNDSVKQIAFNCGFSSEGGFCTTFRKRLGVTPTAFRAGR